MRQKSLTSKLNITLSTGKVIETKEGESILESFKHSGIFLTSSCGGKGVCGKCKIIVQSGDVESRSHIKLSKEEIRKGYALACMTTPLGDITVDIPKQSILTVEGQIVTGRAKDLLGLLHSTGEDIDPLSERIVLKLPKPTLDDNISDLERLKRELFANGLGCLRVPSRFMSNLARAQRRPRPAFPRYASPLYAQPAYLPPWGSQQRALPMGWQ